MDKEAFPFYAADGRKRDNWYRIIRAPIDRRVLTVGEIYLLANDYQ
jgi:hypothetical protein